MRRLGSASGVPVLQKGLCRANPAWNTPWFLSHFSQCSLPWLCFGMRPTTGVFSISLLRPRPISLKEQIHSVRHEISLSTSACDGGSNTDSPWDCQGGPLKSGGGGGSQRGQATVEAAVILPALMLTLALLLQPVCLSYSRAIMREAAAECARAAATAYNGEVDVCRAFVLRRLEAVPEVALFHVGGEDDWDVSIERTEKHVEVRVKGHARPLPLMGAVMALAGQSDGQGVVLEVCVSEDTRPGWLEGSYADWQSIWK